MYRELSPTMRHIPCRAFDLKVQHYLFIVGKENETKYYDENCTPVDEFGFLDESCWKGKYNFTNLTSSYRQSHAA